MAEQRLIADRYRLDEVVGSGGMGVVWRAYDQRIGRTVAIKELRFPSTLSDEERTALTKRAMVEAQSAGRLDHRNIVSVHDVIVENERPYIVMRLIDGASLDKVVARGGPLSPTRAATLGLELLDALGAAHAAEIVHRDVKPQNVLVSRDGTALLTDFSIAAVSGTETLTRTGVLLGSPGYIPPERLMTGEVGPPGDLFALGATLYFAVEGVGPFTANETFAGLFATAMRPHPRPERAGPLAPLLDGLLAKSPEDRLSPERARALLQELVDASATRSGEFTPPSDLAAAAAAPGPLGTPAAPASPPPAPQVPAAADPAAAAAPGAESASSGPDPTAEPSRPVSRAGSAQASAHPAAGSARPAAAATPAEPDLAVRRPGPGAAAGGRPVAVAQGDPPNNATTAAFDGAPVTPLSWPPASAGRGPNGPPGPGTGGTPSGGPARKNERWKQFAAALVILLLAIAAGVIGSSITTDKTRGASSSPTAGPPRKPDLTYTSPSPPPSPTATGSATDSPTPSPSPTTPSPDASPSTSTAPPAVPAVASAAISLAKPGYQGDCSSFSFSVTVTITLTSGPSDLSYQLREGGGQAYDGNAGVTAESLTTTQTVTFRETDFKGKKITLLLTVMKPNWYAAATPQTFTVDCVQPPPPTSAAATP